MTLVRAEDPDRAARFVGIVVPAHDEDDSVESCLGAIHDAARHLRPRGVHVQPILVLDRCSDSTGDRATDPRHPWAASLAVVESCAGNVGAARRRGFERALELADGIDPAAIWLATTDADSTVPVDWLTTQLAWRAAGADALAGTVGISSWAGQPRALPRRYRQHVTRAGLGLGHPHVHGANLSFRALAYESAGGMPPICAAEDHAMWRALQRTGARTVAVPDLEVTTSARREGRAPAGFSGLLRELGDRTPR